MADARDHDAADALKLRRIRWSEELSLGGSKPLADGREIPGAVVNQRDHRSPFVLGSILAIRASRAHATRSARAKALNTAST